MCTDFCIAAHVDVDDVCKHVCRHVVSKAVQGPIESPQSLVVAAITRVCCISPKICPTGPMGGIVHGSFCSSCSSRACRAVVGLLPVSARLHAQQSLIPRLRALIWPWWSLNALLLPLTLPNVPGSRFWFGSSLSTIERGQGRVVFRWGHPSVHLFRNLSQAECTRCFHSRLDRKSKSSSRNGLSRLPSTSVRGRCKMA